MTDIQEDAERSRSGEVPDRSDHAFEVASGQRFRFGQNWRRFALEIDEARIATAEESLRHMLERRDLEGLRFLDVGCGSGLFSLAARRLGARVHGFDFDPESVACTKWLRDRFRPDDPLWTTERGSALDASYLRALGTHDVVYAWGVLHHTGDLWRALEQVQTMVAPGGQLFVGIYNDRGIRSRLWRSVKRIYSSSALGRVAVLVAFVPAFALRGLALDLLRAKSPFARYGGHRGRGMSVVRDWVDWLGGYPFEYARPEEIFDFCRARGFELQRLRTNASPQGINELVLRRRS